MHDLNTGKGAGEVSVSVPQRGSITVIDGAKGGIGKSMLAMLVADYLRETYGDKAAVIDGDLTNRDIVSRFEDADVYTGEFDLRIEAEWVAALDHISEIGCRHAVVNLPATARVTDDFSDTISEVAAKLDMDLKVGFVLDKNQESIELLRQSSNTGLVSISEKFAPIVNRHLGDARQYTVWSNHELRKHLLDDPRCVGEIEVKELYRTAVGVLDQIRKPPSKILEVGGLMVATHAQLRSWSVKTTGALRPLIDA